LDKKECTKCNCNEANKGSSHLGRGRGEEEYLGMRRENEKNEKNEKRVVFFPKKKRDFYFIRRILNG
jgi:hypothetical protein